MGFDLYVILNNFIDPETGSAHVWDYSTGSMQKKPFMNLEYVIPENYRAYLQQRGPQFHSYIKPFGESCSQCSAELFLHYYPKWTVVKKEIGNTSEWTKTDHDGFKKALEWLVSKNIYGLTWSY